MWGKNSGSHCIDDDNRDANGVGYKAAASSIILASFAYNTRTYSTVRELNIACHFEL